ncbi:UNVERIFIED_CONTAM: hypothetical protein FKN15_008831 [Acipenser sinensis]
MIRVTAPRCCGVRSEAEIDCILQLDIEKRSQHRDNVELQARSQKIEHGNRTLRLKKTCLS